jgi:TonB-linked SusC/RagA family outer membrane protein
MIFSLLKSRGGLFFIAGIFYCLNASAGNKVESAGTTSAIYSSAESNHHDQSKFFERKTKIQNVPHFKKEVRGTVTDSSGILANVSVYVKNQPNIGTTTDQNGKYLLDVPDENSILVFEMTGYETVELPVKGKSVINAFLKVSHQGLDEVVVVAYGKQKKQSVVGSITTIDPQELKISSSNLTQALAGKLAGVIAYQRSGEPGADNAEFFIRGATTFGYKKDPLILIDGMEYSTTELARLNVDDIASFSIMKDATANALYGARGANGVILITTKEGKEGRAKIDIRYEKTMSEATRMVQLADPVTYMKLENESVLTRNPLGILPYSQEKIDNTISGVNPDYYPTNDWQSLMFSPQTYNQRINFNLAGGGKIATYYIASSMNQDNGNLKVDHRNNFNTNINLKTYTIRSNVSIKVTKSTTALVRLFGTFDGYTGPQTSGSAMYLNVMRTNPVMFKPYYAADSQHRFINHILFGNAEVGNYFNPYADMVKGYQQYSNSLMGAQAEVQQDLSGIITPGLSLRGMITTNRRANFSVNRAYIPFYYSTTSYDKISNTYRLNDLNADKGTDFIDFVPGSKSVLSTFHGELATNYNRNFGKNGVTGMAILMLQNDVSGNESTLQRSLPSRNITLGGRATYSYDNKYFIESNFAYNGSERFYKNQRFGFFPSVGVAWSVSNEPFFQPFKNIFTKMRIRGNYGLVGNDAIGSASDRFFYLSNINMNDAAYGASFGTDGGYSRPGISVSRYDNTAITWETARNSTFGLETTLFGKIDITAEYFTEERYNILMDRASIPNTMGLEGATPKANVGKSHSESVDISANYHQYFTRDFNISIMGNFTFARNKFKAYEEPQYKYPWSYRVGQPINQQWGYIAERLFVDEEEVRSSPTQVFGNTKTMAGDIKYRDVNGDGVINQDDMVPIGFPTSPEIIYGFWFTSEYKNFDFSFGLQGSARSSFWIDPASTAPFISYRYKTNDPAPDGVLLNNQLLKAYADNHWSEDNRNLYALWPRLSHDLNSNNNQPNTWFMRNGAFLRVKQIQFGYSLPRHTIKKIGMNKFRVYFTGSNLFTFSAFKLWDVEMGGDGLKYPIQKSFTIGIDAGF